MTDTTITVVKDAIRRNYKTSTDWVERAEAEVELSGNNKAIWLFHWAIL